MTSKFNQYFKESFEFYCVFFSIFSKEIYFWSLYDRKKEYFKTFFNEISITLKHI